MKRLVSIILVTILLMSLAVTPVFAESSGLINEYLQEKLDAIGDDDKIAVWIWIYSAIDMDAIEHQALVETGLVGEELDTLDEIDAYRKARTRLIADYYEAENQAILDKIGVAEEDIIFSSSLTSSFILELTKTKVYEVAQMQEIASIDYYDQTEYDPPIGPDVDDPTEVLPPDGYKSRFVEKYGEPMYYSEFCRYPDNADRVPKWVLVQAAVSRVMVDPGEDPTRMFIVNGDLVFGADSLYLPFKTSFAVYDVAKDEFFDLTEVDFREYGNLDKEVIQLGIADIVGDLDGDGEISVLDATKVQLIVAKMANLKNFYVADYNRDNDLDVMDATAIQRKIAKLDLVDDGKAVIVEEEVYFYDDLPEMPYGVTNIEYQTLDYYNDYTTVPSVFGYTVFYAIIKSKSQYDEVMKVYNDEFDEAFFEDKYLVVQAGKSGERRSAPYDLCVKDDTLYFSADSISGGVNPPPIEYFFASVTAVDKEVLKGVTDIVRVK